MPPSSKNLRGVIGLTANEIAKVLPTPPLGYAAQCLWDSTQRRPASGGKVLLATGKLIGTTSLAICLRATISHEGLAACVLLPLLRIGGEVCMARTSECLSVLLLSSNEEATRLLHETLSREAELATAWNPEELFGLDRKSTRLNSSHIQKSRMPSSA